MEKQQRPINWKEVIVKTIVKTITILLVVLLILYLDVLAIRGACFGVKYAANWISGLIQKIGFHDIYQDETEVSEEVEEIIMTREEAAKRRAEEEKKLEEIMKNDN